MATQDTALQEKSLKSVLSKLARISLENKTPPEIGIVVHKTVRKMTGNPDPYKRVKEEYNQKAKRLYPSLKREVKRAKDSLFIATKVAIAGNIIDFGPTSRFDLEHTIKEVLSTRFTINHFPLLKQELENARRVVYLGDNTGEIVFDRLLLEEIKNKQITFVVKGGPHLNDATPEEVRFAGIHKLAEIKTVSNGEPGTGPKRNSKRFINWLKSQDIVISKGQGNYESLSEADANIFFLLKVKCPMIARDIGAPVGSTVVKSVKK